MLPLWTACRLLDPERARVPLWEGGLAWVTGRLGKREWETGRSGPWGLDKKSLRLDVSSRRASWNGGPILGAACESRVITPASPRESPRLSHPFKRASSARIRRQLSSPHHNARKREAAKRDSTEVSPSPSHEEPRGRNDCRHLDAGL